MRKIKKTIFLLLFAYISFQFILHPSEFMNSAQKAVLLCINTVIPSLLPFFIISGLFIQLGFAKTLSTYISGIMKPLFNIRGCGAAALVLGFISGYPIGATTTAELYKKGEITKSEAERLLAWTNNAGPVFVCGAIGYYMLSSQTAGFIIYISHILAAIITGIIFKFYKTDTYISNYLPETSLKSKNKLKNFGSGFCEAISSSAENILKVCSLIIFFSAVCSVIPHFRFSPFIHSLLEITDGISKVSDYEFDIAVKIPVITFFLSLSGLSVFAQVYSIVKPTGLSTKTYILGKSMQAAISFFLAKLFMLFIDPYPAKEVFRPIYQSSITENIWLTSLSIMLIGASAILILLLVGYNAELRKK